MNLIGKLYYLITGDTSGLDKSLKKTDGQVKESGAGLTNLGKIIKGAAFAGAAVFAAKKVVELGGSLINAASDAEETSNKFSVVFKDVADQAEAAATSLSDNFGLSSNAAKTLLSDTGDLLTGFGFTGESALNLSTQVNELAVDLASFTNFSGGAEGASKALTKALLGERESVKALGISILDADVKARVLLNTQQGLTFDTERQAKAYATLQIAQDQSKNAIGDFERSSESFANQQRIAAAAVDDLQVALGDRLLPIATEAVSVFGSLVSSAADYVEKLNEIDRANDRSDKGIATAKERILLADIENEKLKRELADTEQSIRITGDLSGRKRKNIENIKAQIAANDELVTSLKRADGINRTRIAVLDDEAAKEKKLAEETANKIQEQKKYIDFIEDEYSSTEQAKLEQLQAEIDLIKNNIDSYGGLREEQLILIDLKKQEIAEILNKGVAEDEALNKTKAYNQTLIDLNTITAEDQYTIQKAIEDQEKESLERRKQEQEKFYADIVSLGFSAFGAISALISAQTDAQLESLDRQLAAQLDAAGVSEETALEKAEAELAIAKEKEDKEAIQAAENAITKAKIEEEFARKKAKIQYDASLQQWNLSRLQSIASAAQAIITTAASTPYPFNIPLTAAQATINGIQIAAVNAARPVAPAFANGGIVPGNSFSGDNVLTRQNSGEMDLNMRQQKKLFDMINAGGGGNQTIIIRIGNTDFAKAVVNSVNSGAGGVVDARVVR